MTIKSILRVLPGVLILTSVTLSHFISPLWLLLATFVGVNLLQSAFTNWCPLESLLRRTSLPTGCGEVPLTAG